jgi:hypothetical protein
MNGRTLGSGMVQVNGNGEINIPSLLRNTMISFIASEGNENFSRLSTAEYSANIRASSTTMMLPLMTRLRILEGAP